MSESKQSWWKRFLSWAGAINTAVQAWPWFVKIIALIVSVAFVAWGTILKQDLHDLAFYGLVSFAAVIVIVQGIYWLRDRRVRLNLPPIDPDEIEDDEDYWAERDFLELYVIVNVSVKRRAHAPNIDDEPELSRLRELKDAVEANQLWNKNHSSAADAWTKVWINDFRDFAHASGKHYWMEVLERWKVKHPDLAPNEEPGE